MTTPALPTGLIYPFQYFSAARTWFAWNRLTIRQVHALHAVRGFEGQNIYFRLNWPIRFVRLIGLIVDIELAPNCDGRYTLLTLDDGSGECIVVKITRRRVPPHDQSPYPSNTTCDQVDVVIHLGLPTVSILTHPIAIGDVIRVRGTISTFRHVRQIELLRAIRVKDTNEEAAAWLDTAKWGEEVLSRPWILTQQDRQKIDADARKQEILERQKSATRRDANVKGLEKQRKRDEKREVRRLKKEEEYDRGALAGSHVLPTPWEDQG